MNKDKHTPGRDANAEEALREEKNKPEPLYNKTDRNFQDADQDKKDGSLNEGKKPEGRRGSSSPEEKDFTV